MDTTLKLTAASIKMFLRNKQALFFTLVMPLFIMMIFGFIGFDNPPTTDVGLVTNNPSTETQVFLETVKKFPGLKIHEGTLTDEMAALDAGDRAVVLEVPDFLIPKGPQAAAERQDIIAHENVGQEGQAKAIVSILHQYVGDLTLSGAGIQPIFGIQEKEVNSHNLRYIEFLLPGLIALSVMQMSVFSVAFVFTQFKEKGVLKRLLATPMKPFHFVAANGITRLIISLIQAAIFIGIGVFMFKVNIVGSIPLLALNVLLGAVMFLGLGFTISGLAKTADAVPAIANIVVFPMMFLGGTFFAVSSMPQWLQVVAHFLPLTYFSDALREIMTKGAGLTDIWIDMGAMVLWSIVLIYASTITFRFQEKESA